MNNLLTEWSKKYVIGNKEYDTSNILTTKKTNASNLGDLGFSVLIPTFDYECVYTESIINVGGRIARVRKAQKRIDKKKIKFILKTFNNIPEELRDRYEIIAKSAGAFYAEKFYKYIIAKSHHLEQLRDTRVIELLSSYDLASSDSIKAEQEAKRLLMDIIKERIMFDLLSTNGQEQRYDMCINNIHDTRLPDSFSTYGLLQITGTLFKSNGVYLKASVSGVAIEEDIFCQKKITECDIEEYYKKYMLYHNQNLKPVFFRARQIEE